ncbi:DUF3102 domain-containing protein [Clostridium sp. C2-6-12]|uniref:DUF3102 domain-containing protein n=1 Tax=Clostridium sp. C2-6-12 TaxID=2698832 RepID=UPI00136BFB1D|nr:DUF3102 domain-containing protein [Clostridium sp. C2-6-12]
MNEISISRTPDLIAAEINHIKEQTRIQVLNNSIEIGRKLVEAKSLVSHGEWGKWLEEKVDYSKSTANNLMKIFEKYSDEQMNLLGNAKSQAIGELGYTQALTLLGIHDDKEREKFIEENKVEDMSTRELKKAIDELNKAKSEKEALRKELEDFKGKSKAEQDKLKEAAKKNEKVAKELKEEANKLLENLNKKEEETAAARREVEEYQVKIKELEEKPIDVITAGIEVDEEKIKELEEAHKKEIEALISQKEEAENRVKDLEKNSAKHNENIVKYRVHFDSLVAGFKSLLEDVSNIKEVDPQEAQKYADACKSLINMMTERL